jgi:hypothetical protein
MSAAGVLEAAPIQFTFDCTIVDATTCAPGGPFGTLTLSNSVVDPNRVDVDLVVYPHAGVTQISRFYMNTNVVVPAFHDWRLLLQTAPAGSYNTDLNGSIGYIVDGFGPGVMFTFDLRPDPPNTAILTYSGSILLASTLAGHAEFNLDVSMFNVKDENNQLYAAFDTLPNGTSLNAGARTSVDLGAPATPSQVPEPGALVLMVTALASLRFGLRRANKRRR